MGDVMERMLLGVCVFGSVIYSIELLIYAIKSATTDKKLVYENCHLYILGLCVTGVLMLTIFK